MPDCNSSLTEIIQFTKHIVNYYQSLQQSTDRNRFFGGILPYTIDNVAVAHFQFMANLAILVERNLTDYQLHCISTEPTMKFQQDSPTPHLLINERLKSAFLGAYVLTDAKYHAKENTNPVMLKIITDFFKVTTINDLLLRFRIQYLHNLHQTLLSFTAFLGPQQLTQWHPLLPNSCLFQSITDYRLLLLSGTLPDSRVVKFKSISVPDADQEEYVLLSDRYSPTGTHRRS
jgi:hypothetical protein